MKLCLGHRHVRLWMPSWHFGSQAKMAWLAWLVSPTQVGSLDLGFCVFVFFWSPSMANLDPAIMAAQETKAARWCQAQGIEKTSDLAFYFTLMRHWWAVGAFVLLLQEIGAHRTENSYRKKAVGDRHASHWELLSQEGCRKWLHLFGWGGVFEVGGCHPQACASDLGRVVADLVGCSHWPCWPGRALHCGLRSWFGSSPEDIYQEFSPGLGCLIAAGSSWSSSVGRGSASPGSSPCGGQAYIDDLVARPDHDHGGLVCDHESWAWFGLPAFSWALSWLGPGGRWRFGARRALGEQGWFLLVYSKTYRVTSCIACFAFHHLILERAHMSDPQRHCMPMHTEAVKWTLNTAAGVVGKWSTLLLLTSNTYVYTTTVYIYLYIIFVI